MILSGGRELAPKAFRPVSDPVILARLPETSRGKVLQVDMKAQGITDFGEMKVHGFGHPYANPGLELFIDDKPMPLARWPNRGMVPIGNVLDPGSIPRQGDFSGRGGTFTFDVDRPQRWKAARDIWLSGLFHYGFADDTLKVKSIDYVKKTITLAQPHVYGISTGRAFNTYYAFNLLEEIDRPGEWFLDRETGILYLWPPAALEKAKISVSLLEGPMVAMEGASFITLRGLTFEVSRGIGVTIERGTSNLIAGCTFRNLGVLAVCIGQGAKPSGRVCGGWVMDLAAEKGQHVTIEPVSRQLGEWTHAIYGNTVWNRNAGTNHRVTGCDIYQTGAGGISLGGGDRKTLTPAGNSVRNCHIHDFNRLERSYRTAVNIDGVGNRVANCLIHDAPGGAILLHGNDHIIEFNEIHHTCRLADDMGVFYMGRDPSEQGNILRYNFWHHNGGNKGATCTVYLDDGSCGTIVVGNVFYRNRGRTIWINGGHDHLFRHNMFIYSGAAIASGWDDKRWYHWIRTPLVLLRLRRDLDITQPPYASRYPKLADLFEQPLHCRRSNEVLRNLSVGSGNFGGGRNHVEDNLVIPGSPRSATARHANFALDPEWVAWEKRSGLKPIPFTRIGLYKGKYRTTLPPRTSDDEIRSAPVRDPKTREFKAMFAGMDRFLELAGQGGWSAFGDLPSLRVLPAAASGEFAAGPVAVATGMDSWCAVWHGVILDPKRDITLLFDACLPAPLRPHSTFELYLNQGQTHADSTFGIAVVGGAEGGQKDAVGIRRDSCGPRVLTTEHLPPGHWVRLRLVIPANRRTGRLFLRDLTAGEKEFRRLTFANGAEEVDLTRADTWAPGLPGLDALVLRLGAGARAGNLWIEN